MTNITARSVLESTRSGSEIAELWSSVAVREEAVTVSDARGDVSISGNHANQTPPINPDSRSDPVATDTGSGSPVSVDNPRAQTTPVQDDQLPVALVLNPATYDAINNIQQLMMADEWDTALEQLNAMYSQRDQLNGFERSTMLMFYTNVLLHHRMYDEASIVYQEVLTIPETHDNVRARATRALEQLDALAQQ